MLRPLYKPTSTQQFFVEMPRGFAQPWKVLKLRKSLYGLKQSPRNHFKNLSNKLKTLRVPSFGGCVPNIHPFTVILGGDDTLFLIAVGRSPLERGF
jgi:hypothetical protein